MQKHNFNMLHIYKSQKQLPSRQKFSYRTAQEYCDLVQKSIKKQRSISKEDRRLIITSTNPHSQEQSFATSKSHSKERLPHLVMRSKLNDCSVSVGDRSQSRDKSISGTSGNQRTNLGVPIVKRRLPPTQKPLSKKLVTSYQQQHLIFNLEEENKKLSEAISQNEQKIIKIKSQIDEQRSVQEIQREIYLQQIKKLRETLERQSITCSTIRLDEDQCSFAKELSSDFLQQAE